MSGLGTSSKNPRNDDVEHGHGELLLSQSYYFACTSTRLRRLGQQLPTI